MRIHADQRSRSRTTALEGAFPHVRGVRLPPFAGFLRGPLMLTRDARQLRLEVEGRREGVIWFQLAGIRDANQLGVNSETW